MFDKKYEHRNRSVIYYYPNPIEKASDELLQGSHLSVNSSHEGGNNTIYIHTPFCKSICAYCSFIKVVKRDDLVKEYLHALKKEIKMYAETEYVKALTFSAIFFGGGTPTILSIEQLVDLIQTVFDSFNITEKYELTIEGTLSTFTVDMLLALKDIGVTRISMGVQTFNEAIGEDLNLPQKQSIAETVINNAYDIGIKEINIDLMYDLPGQSMEIFKQDLLKATSTKITHISLFAMNIITDSAIFRRTDDKSKLEELLDDERDFEYYNLACDILEKNGFIQKTSTDWYREGHEFKINTYEIDGRCERLSLGVGSLGELNEIVYINDITVERYIEVMKLEENRFPISIYSTLWNNKMNQYMILGMRKSEINMSTFKKIFNIDIYDVFRKQIDTLLNEKYAVINGDKICMTRLGAFYVVNISVDLFMDEPYKSCHLLPMYYQVKQRETCDDVVEL